MDFDRNLTLNQTERISVCVITQLRPRLDIVRGNKSPIQFLYIELLAVASSLIPDLCCGASSGKTN